MSNDLRIREHPVLEPRRAAGVEFRFDGRALLALEGEVISSALFAHGIRVFGRHSRDGAPLGIFCANGQCSQCMVIADGKSVKACITAVTPGMDVRSLNGLAPLPLDTKPLGPSGVETRDVEALIVGGGPAGISAAIELGRAGVSALLIDDKSSLGGKLTLQTHSFFGSTADCYAGTRGIEIADILASDLGRFKDIEVLTDAVAVGVYSDLCIGIVHRGRYLLVSPKAVIVAAGAREKNLVFPGADLPGVYGAGAFQTLVNRDLVRPARRLFIVGGGNVGLIAGYHALQAGMDVVGLVEALPQCGGYKVHEDKLRRLGVPVWTSHTVVRAEGNGEIERVVIAAADQRFCPIPGSEQGFDVDTLLVAVGLSPVNEFTRFLKLYGIPVHEAGDSGEIAEASAAIFSGRIVGRTVATEMGRERPVPSAWPKTAAVLKSKPGRTIPLDLGDPGLGVFPVIRCVQEIPCNPCTDVCPEGSIRIDTPTIMGLPRFAGTCRGCGRCVSICPGLAISLVDTTYDPEKKRALVILPFEFGPDRALPGSVVATVDLEGRVVGQGRVVAFRQRPDQRKRLLLSIDVPWEDRLRIAGFRLQDPTVSRPAASAGRLQEEDPIVCRCERVRRSEIVREIRDGARDINELKAVIRTCMGGCGGKTCREPIFRIFREEGVPLDDVTGNSDRPLFTETALGMFAEGSKER